MNFETFYALAPLVERANRLLDDIDVVSLDIFDTLLVRRVHDPDMVKFPVAQYIADRAAALDIPCTRRDAWRARWEIEKQHRRRHGQQYPDHEARYDEYMGEALARLFGARMPAGLLDDVRDFELKLETAMLVPRAAIVQWIRSLHTRGKRILLISDIYLSAVYLKRLVCDQQLDPYIEDVVSSADSFNAKASGAAWPLVQQRFSLDTRRWLHVGDNPVSDGLRPAEFGIRALVIRDAREKQRKGIARAVHHNAVQQVFWKGRDVQQLMLPLEAENAERDPLYADGYHLFGMLLANFIHIIAERCRDLKIPRIYFCAREGWTFLNIWQRAIPYYFPHQPAPEASYLYVSRMALASPACAAEGITSLMATVAMLPAGNRDIRDLCRVFSLDIEPLREMFERSGLTDHDPIGPQTPGSTPELRRRFQELLFDSAFQQEVMRQAQPAQAALETYLAEQGLFDNDEIAIVDIGWLGTIQDYLLRAIYRRADTPRVHGFLLGATRVIPYDANFPNFRQYISGLLCDRYQYDFAQNLITNAKDLFEEACRAPHPTLMAYRLDGTRARLAFRATDDAAAQAEHEQNQDYAPLRQGILDAAERYAVAVTVLGYRAGELRPWINYLLLNRLAFPRTAEVARMRHHSHQDDFAGKHAVPRRILRRSRTLWDRSLTVLRFDPSVRLRYYLKGAGDLLRGKI